MFGRRITLAGLLLALSSGAYSQDLTLDWQKQLIGNNNQGSYIYSTGAYADGSLMMASAWGATSSAGLTVSWGDANITDASGNAICGAPYTEGYGTAYSKNLLLSKVSQSGDLLWSVYSFEGYCDKVKAVATADGGILACVTATQASSSLDEPFSKLLSVVDAKGSKFSFPNPFPDAVNDGGQKRKTTLAVLVSVDSEGSIKWAKLLKSATPNSVAVPYSILDFLVQADGSIVISGLISESIIFDSANGDVVVKNNAGGADAFVARLDSNGLLLDYNVDESGEGREFASVIICADGNDLYSLSIDSPAPKNFTFSKFEASKPLAQKQVLKTYQSVPNSQAKEGYNLNQLKKIGDNLYVSGSITGGIASNGETVFASDFAAAQREGMLLKFDSEGSFVSSFVFGALNTNVWGADLYGDNIWAVCTRMTNASADNDNGVVKKAGVHFVVLDNNLNVVTPVEVLQSANATDACSPVFVNGAVYFASRRGKAAASLLGAGNLGTTTYNFNSVVARYVLPAEVVTGVKSLAPADNSIACDLLGRRALAGRRGLVVKNGKLIFVR